MVELRLVRTVEHQPHPVAVEERQSWRRFEQQFQAEDIFVEVSGALHVVGADLDLAQARNPDSCCSCGHGLDLLRKIS